MKWKTCGKCGQPTVPDAKGKCGRCGGQITNKNHAVIVHFNGMTFRSKAEHDRYQALCWKEKAGFVEGVVYRPPKVWVAPGIGWDVDFYYFDKEKAAFWFEEFKGKDENDYRIKLGLWKYTGPAPLRIVKKDPRTKLFHIEDEVVPLGIAAFARDLAKARAA